MSSGISNGEPSKPESGSAPAPGATEPARRPGFFNRLLESNLIRRVSYDNYRDNVRNLYDGPQGAMLMVSSMLSGHLKLGERILKSRQFDLAGARKILDVGSGAGQIAGHLLKYADPEARITCTDLSHAMLGRARSRLQTRPDYVVSDLCKLPFASGSFDCVTCGYVLEHLPDARPGLLEIARVLQPGGRLLLFTSEDNFGGAWTSRFWHCRTYNRQELRRTSEDVGLSWRNELWFTPLHRMLRAGGICVEIEKLA